MIINGLNVPVEFERAFSQLFSYRATPTGGQGKTPNQNLTAKQRATMLSNSLMPLAMTNYRAMSSAQKSAWAVVADSYGMEGPQLWLREFVHAYKNGFSTVPVPTTLHAGNVMAFSFDDLSYPAGFTVDCSYPFFNRRVKRPYTRGAYVQKTLSIPNSRLLTVDFDYRLCSPDIGYSPFYYQIRGDFVNPSYSPSDPDNYHVISTLENYAEDEPWSAGWKHSSSEYYAVDMYDDGYFWSGLFLTFYIGGEGGFAFLDNFKLNGDSYNFANNGDFENPLSSPDSLFPSCGLDFQFLNIDDYKMGHVNPVYYPAFCRDHGITP